MCLLTETANSGIFVQEGLARGQRLPARRESVVAFIGSSARGPVGIPVAVRSVDEYRRRFGTPGHRSRVQDLLAQFFDNGGANAIFVRVSGSDRRHRIEMPAGQETLVLSAVNPGPHECLRAAIDFDGIAAGDDEHFNLVIHRLLSHNRPIVEKQEIYRAVSIDPGAADFVTHALIESDLVRVGEPVPSTRPDITRNVGVEVGTAYEYADDDWQEHAPLTDYDLVGCASAGTGIFALDRIPILDMLCVVPDADDIGPVALFAAERYCQGRQALLFIDPPASWRTVADVVRYRLSSVFSSPNVVTYFPRPQVRAGSGLNRTPSALGALMGRLVADDAVSGVWDVDGSDALELRYRARLSCGLGRRDQMALRRLGVNSLHERVGGTLVVTGMVTMDRSSGLETVWSDLRLRRLGLFIVGSIARGTRWAAFVGDDEKTWDDVRRQVSDFMVELCDAGALPGGGVGDTWYVTRDSETFGGAAGDSGLGDFIVGFALDDNGFRAFRFEHGQLECRVHSVGWQPGVALAS